MTIATMVLGALAIAAGAGDAGMGIMMAGQQAAMGKFLAFTRAQEATADAAAVKYLHGRASAARGCSTSSASCRTRNTASRSMPRTATTAPTRCRTSASRRWSRVLKADPAWNKPIDPALEARFERVKAKLLGFVNPSQAVIKYPESDQSIPAHYARAYAYHLGGYPDKAQAEANALLAADPHDPFFLELKGQILLEGGKPKDAIPPLREAVQRSGDAPMIAAMLGHALVATEDPKNFTEAKQVLKAAVSRDNQDPFAWYQLGIIYDREGDPARAALATAERSNLEGNPKLALASAQMAMKGIPAGYSGLSSRAGHRHGVADRARQERQEIPGRQRPVSDGQGLVAVDRRRSSGGVIGSVADRSALLIFAAPAIDQQPDRPPGPAGRSQDPFRHRRCASRRAICAGARRQSRGDRNARSQARGRAPPSPR